MENNVPQEWNKFYLKDVSFVNLMMLNRKESRNDTESKNGKATNAEHEHKVHRNK